MKKTVVISIVALLLCLAAVGGTVAWLTAADSVTNTFTVGKIDIELTEDGWTNNSKIYPGAVIDKNPVITVKADSEDCFVYALVDNQLNATVTGAVSLDIDTTNKWHIVATSGSRTLYRYKVSGSVVAQSVSDQDLPLFTTVTVDDTVVTSGNIASLGGKTIVIKAYVHQANATTMSAADAAARSHFTI